jgi:hypothetical protein
MSNATLKFAVVTGLALVVLYSMRKAEKFTGYNESETNRFETNAPYAAGPAAKTAAKKIKKTVVSKSKSALLGASTQHTVRGGADPNTLPKPKGDAGFGQFAPDPKTLTGQNFVDASRWVSLGAMTSRRNINRDLRADIPVPKNNALSPWNQSSIEQVQPGKSLDCP